MDTKKHNNYIGTVRSGKVKVNVFKSDYLQTEAEYLEANIKLIKLMLRDNND